MSFRELRNFTEMLRTLGYPRLISMENFRTPNFKLVAEILAWLVKKYDPDYDLSLVLDTEQDRVIFIKTAALFLVQKARIKVNPKKLYQADGYAVQEMLKVTTVLYDAVKNQFTFADDSEETASELATITSNINAKLNDLRLSRQLAADIPERGASLYDLLSKEVELREQRSAALARPLELNDVEKSIKSSIKAVEDEVKQTVHNLNNIASDETTLDAKIEKKKTDLERQQKRLAQLQSHRPAYMDDYEKYELQLKQLYSLYVLKYRNVSYLEQMQVEYDKAEQERNLEAELSLRQMAEKMRQEENTRLAMAERLDTAAAMEAGDELSDAEFAIKGPKVQGNITGAGLSDDEDDDDDSLLSDEEDDEESEMLAAVGGKTRAVVEESGLGRGKAGKSMEQTSEDRMDEKMNERSMGGDISPPDSEDDF